jgi:transcription-repair coupling factor (superfamily II helicase)
MCSRLEQSCNQDLATLERWIRGGVSPVRVTGLSGSAQSFFLSQFLANLMRPCLVILPGHKEARKLYKELQFFMSDPDTPESPDGLRLHEFAIYDLTPLSGLSPDREVISRRLQALYVLMSDRNPVVITSLEALLFRVLPKEAMIRSLEYLEEGEEVDRDLFLKRLEATGYQRVSLVEERGDYSVRGGVIDVFPPLYSLPLRLEFWGNRLESMRQFDPFSQRSKKRFKEMILLPSTEVIMDEETAERARSMGRLPSHPVDRMGFPGQEAWLNHFYPHLDTLFQYLPQNGLVILFDPHRTVSVVRKTQERFQEDVHRFRLEAAERGVPFPEIEGIRVPLEELLSRLENHQRLEMSQLDLQEKEAPKETIRLKSRFQFEGRFEVTLGSQGRASMAPLAEHVSEWVAARATVAIVVRTEQQANRLKEILGNYEVEVDRLVPYWAEVPKGPGLYLCIGRISEGFIWPELGLYVVSEDQIFGPKRPRPSRKARESALAWSSFSQLRDGDFVVHEEHGIGRYGGLTKMEIANKINDFVIIEYVNNDKLYIPADRVSVLQKYAGADDRNPKLDQLGGRSWNIAKQKAKKSIRKIARQLVELYALRKYRQGHAFSPPDFYLREFEATFEHEETDDQAKAVEDVLEDMASEQPMDRLICGDVGFGKTEVAVRAAFKAVSDGKQVALLVPTTVLAEQHYQTFKKRMAAYPLRVGVLSRFKTRTEQARILAKLRSGEIDILIGTHRILQKDVKYADLGLLIIDEEQRFGVKQKEAVKRYRSLIDVLAITATPIPRTLHMSMMGVRDLSIIETPPEDRLSIQSYLSPYDEHLILRAIESELDRGGQVFFVHNKVRSIEDIGERLRSLVPGARFAVAHGQMKERDLETTMLRFLEREIDVLVCTTIIESGLDIPSVNTIIINEADRLGLAQIYQLRGRVGRGKEKAYAYLLISDGAALTRDAEKRLKALMDFSQLGSGLHLAMHDLKIRGGGNILGFAQSGHISAIGYELYLKFIERAVTELKGEEWHDDINPEINIDMPAYLPGDYVLDTDVRLNLYRRLSALLEESELEDIAEEIRDRFGPLPQEIRNLLGLVSIRLYLKKMRINRLDIGNSSFTVTFSQEKTRDPDNLVRLVSSHPERFQFLSENKIKVNIGCLSPEEDLPRIRKAISELDPS